MQLPIGAEADFKGVVDLVTMKALVWSAEAAKGEMYDVVDIPATHTEAAEEWRGKLLEAVAENDDEMMELYLEGEEPSVEQLYAAIRRITIASGKWAAAPPSPRCSAAPRSRTRACSPCSTRSCATCRRRSTSRPSRATTSRTPTRSSSGKPSEEEPLSALAFKIMSDPHLGKLTFIRVYSGRLVSRHCGAELRQGQEGAHRQDLPDAREQA
jgi:elongation factor G